MYIVSREVSHLRTELEDVQEEKDQAFVNCDTFVICSLKPSVWGNLKNHIQDIDFAIDEPFRLQKNPCVIMSLRYAFVLA